MPKPDSILFLPLTYFKVGPLPKTYRYRTWTLLLLLLFLLFLYGTLTSANKHKIASFWSHRPPIHIGHPYIPQSAAWKISLCLSIDIDQSAGSWLLRNRYWACQDENNGCWMNESFSFMCFHWVPLIVLYSWNSVSLNHWDCVILIYSIRQRVWAYHQTSSDL